MGYKGMKLIRCNECMDIVMLTYRERTCWCGKSFGKYYDSVLAWYKGPCTPLGIANDSFHNALESQPDRGKGKTFEAFVIPKQCPTFFKDGRVNGIECPQCGKLLWSKYGHDFQECPCGACYVDGGQSPYYRIGGTNVKRVTIDISEEVEKCV